MSDYVFVLPSGENVPVVITARRGVHNITLRPKCFPQRMICITRPWLVSDKCAIKFLESKRLWVLGVFQKTPCKIMLQDGDEIDFLGRKMLLKHCPNLRSNKLSDDASILYVGGSADMFQRRIRDFVKSELLREIKDIMHNVPNEFLPHRIALRDTVSRWGSCSTSGTMSFSWRLAFAPYDVMRYVVMHELAHTKHMNHSPEFWATVRDLYGSGVERAKRWLKQNGASLHRYF